MGYAAVHPNTGGACTMIGKSIPSVSVTYASNGSSTKANALGMRPMQEQAYAKRGEPYLLIKSPPASGKSRALMARLDIEVKDRFGQPVVPREWFLVPLFVIDEAVERIKDGTITRYVYYPETAKLGRVTE